jgi:hypothetical protein
LDPDDYQAFAVLRFLVFSFLVDNADIFMFGFTIFPAFVVCGWEMVQLGCRVFAEHLGLGERECGWWRF